ncbi:MAG: 3-hydroxyacyl-ACP dehydratase FabZ family protein [Planctomycetota bacterium]
MRFWLLDRICSFEPDAELTAVKSVSLAEEYLADHFPQFPVLPGVFMLESAAQAAAWLIRMSEDYAHSVVVLKEARSVKFTDFVSPGNSLRMTVAQSGQEGQERSFTFRGEVDGNQCVSGRLTMHSSNLATEAPDQAELDARMIEHFRSVGSQLMQGVDASTP